MSARDALAAMLNGREYGDEISKLEEASAKANGLLVVFGASDDLMEFRGAVHDECGAYDGTTAMVHALGVLPEWEDFDEKDDEDMVQAYFANKRHAFPVAAAWCEGEYSWVISANVPHATFDILEDGEKYCRGIVIDMADLESVSA
jgi:hypothetical protein